ncbi:probable E3 ubiquitin-protein ligase HERC4 isoform X2 [Littorina saxatilis]|uniref:probable E3 ubiquitin-protein ligase HERC4 isoform X2 n=1 Tax=Littorina saxatilis TaxID=31220 RepID=UPI0038B4AC04
MSGVLGWGKAGFGQLGLKGEEIDSVAVPKQIPNVRGAEVADIGCGENHTLVCNNDGILYTCGNNDYNQLGHDKSTRRFECVDALKAQRVHTVRGGNSHSMALTDAHEVFTWGSNKHGQLGRSKVNDELRRVPKLVKSLAVHSVVQIACGTRHCIALTSEGLVTTWGANDYGQLGLGSVGGVKDTPEMLACLHGIPVAQVAAGGNHTFTLSKSGAIHGWGKNRNGQLGLGDNNDRNVPTACRSLRSQKIKYLSCGEDHSAALTQDGRMFTFGAGSYGQLGHGSSDDVIVPRQVMELTGSQVTQVACGRRHSLAHIAKSGRLYTFGLGGSGQLGIDSTGNKDLPCCVQGPFVPDKAVAGSSAPMTVDNDGSPLVVQRIFAGGDHCFIIYRPADMRGDVWDYRVRSPSTQILTFNSERLTAVESLQSDESPPVELSDEVTKIFSHASCLNGSFLLLNEGHMGSSSKNHGVDMDQVRECFGRLQKAPNIIIKQKVCNSLESLVQLAQSPCDIEVMRVYLILPECHLFDEPKHYATLLTPFGQSILNLDKPAAKFLCQWWGKMKPSCFNRLVRIYKQVIEFLLRLGDTDNALEVSKRQRGLYVSLELLKKLNTVNEDNNQLVPYHRFYIPELKERVNIRNDYISWVQQTQQAQQFGNLFSQGLHFCSYPFLFDAGTKSILLQTDATLQMRNAMEEVNRRNMMGLFMPIDPVSAALVVMVSRENMVRDTLATLEKCRPQDFKKPLRVVFLGEEAVDEGGVRKEFFMLLLREVLDPKYGMFLYMEESHLMWFNAQTFEDNIMFDLIGAVCGLAIYNFTIIDLHFPLALYKKLLKRNVTLEDLRELMPTVGRNLQELLDYEDGDEEDVFCLNFVMNQELFGEVKAVELCESGATISVTQENKHEYVDLYVDFILNKSVEAQFNAFSEGFHKVCGGRVLELFHPQELQAMVIGNEDYDFSVFEQNTEYKGEFYRYHPTIKFFWEIFHDFSLENKKKFLMFLTGSDRIPVLGMSHIKMIIQPTGGGEQYLPVAHTCFNLLDLPKYTSKEAMKEKLLLAIQHSEGFGIV